MAQIDILSGIYTNSASDFRTSYPQNLMVVPLQTGTSRGYLRPADGFVSYGASLGVDRGGINWRGVCYRVMGTKFVSINSAGVITVIGDVGGLGNNTGQCTLDYSFDRLGISAGGRLYYYDGATLTQVTDADLGAVIDFLWVDGYFMTTDGSFLVVTELNDPYSVDPLKYGSSEVDPDPIVGLQKLRDEIYSVNRYSIEVYQNVGGTGFPFQRIPGAMLQRGAVGTYASAVFLENIAFLGGGRNEPPAIWLGSNGSSINISTREIDQILATYPETQLATAVLETRIDSSQKLLYVHLLDRTLVYDGAASQLLQKPIWTVLTTSVTGLGAYRARNFVWCYEKWSVGDVQGAYYGYATDTISTHFGIAIGWEFGTSIIYNEGNGALFHELELLCLTGRVAVGVNPTVWTSYTVDGLTWSQEKSRSLGKTGETLKRITWYQQGFMRNWRCQKFRGNSDALLTISALSMKLEALNA